MPFKKGESGNPGGRPIIALDDGRTVTDLAREHTWIAIEALADILRAADASHASKVSAATVLLDRGWGRPKQEWEGTVIAHDLAEIIACRRQAVIEGRVEEDDDDE